ncbi:mechanosensitive ion channel family protein [Tunicatimonas pelagia]|uniref:mechanosensitive ion channel family protein n=1 Tax=Tunicatimonas pelagia TaxID=931531 RepID=UPI002666410F|nr:mechanosensitive ion channel family protein [Tunicatimonas pelagia]WKN42942.1 mechanosensitive ion channel family protein [Tunicatimonas pelagia]
MFENFLKSLTINFEKIFENNTLEDYLVALGIVVSGFVITRILRAIVIKQLRRLTEATDTDIDDYIVDSIGRFGVPILYFISVYVGVKYLTLTDMINEAIRVATLVVITFFSIRFISSVVLMLLRTYVRQQENGEEKVKQLRGVMLIFNLLIWGAGLLVLLDNLGVNVTAMVAGLGIGGIAIALAAQNILGDLFNYFVIFFDRPFEIGDFIIVDEKLGTIEAIGIKTTRVKSLSGEQLVFSNSDLTSSRIHNFKRMQTRRIVFSVGVIYQTPLEQVKEIPEILKRAVETQELAQFDRAHFKAYGDSSLNYEIVYIVQSADFNVYMNVQQAINFEIFAEFQQRGIEFAYPTRTLYMAGQTDNNQEEKTNPYES